MNINPPKLHIVNGHRLAINGNLQMALAGAIIYEGIWILKGTLSQNLIFSYNEIILKRQPLKVAKASIAI